MALKAILVSLDGIEESVKPLYKKGDDGKFHLEVEGMVDKEKLATFRDNNIELQKQLDALKDEVGKFKDVDITKYKEAMAAIESDVEKKLLKEGKIDEVIQMRTEKMRVAFDEQLKAKEKAILKATDDAQTAQRERNEHIVESELRRNVDNPDFGFQSGVTELLKDQVMREFQFKEGKVVRVKPDGTVVYGEKGEPATINEFLTGIVKDRPYLVKASTGGGAHNNGNNNNNNGSKVMRRSEFDAIQDPVRKAKLMKDGFTLKD